MRVTATGSEAIDCRIATRMVWRCCGVEYPGCVLSSTAKLRIINPAQTSKTSAMAICATTSTFCDRCRSRPALAVRLDPRKAAPGPMREYLSDTIDPKKSPEKIDNPAVKHNDLTLSEISLR